MERLAGRLRDTGGGVRPYAPRFAPDTPLEEATEPELEEQDEAAPAAPAAALPPPALGASVERSTIARYALSAPSPVASTPSVSVGRSPSSSGDPVAPDQIVPLDRPVPLDGDLRADAGWERAGHPTSPPAVSTTAGPSAELAPSWPENSRDASTARDTSAPGTARSGDPGSPVPGRPPAPGDQLVAWRADLAGDAAAMPVAGAPPVGVAPAIRARSAPASPTVHVTIGRVDVRAVLSAPAGRPAPPTPKPPISLGEYLRQRDRGER